MHDFLQCKVRLLLHHAELFFKHLNPSLTPGVGALQGPQIASHGFPHRCFSHREPSEGLWC